MDALFKTVVASVPVEVGAILFTTLCIVGGGLIYFYAPYWGVKRVPGPPTIPLVGHLPLMAKYGPEVFSVLASQYGPIFRSVSCLLLLLLTTFQFQNCFVLTSDMITKRL